MRNTINSYNYHCLKGRKGKIPRKFSQMRRRCIEFSSLWITTSFPTTWYSCDSYLTASSARTKERGIMKDWVKKIVSWRAGSRGPSLVWLHLHELFQWLKFSKFFAMSSADHFESTSNDKLTRKAAYNKPAVLRVCKQHPNHRNLLEFIIYSKDYTLKPKPLRLNFN